MRENEEAVKANPNTRPENAPSPAPQPAPVKANNPAAAFQGRPAGASVADGFIGLNPKSK